MAGVAQGLERLTVAQEAVGSILIIRPKNFRQSGLKIRPTFADNQGTAILPRDNNWGVRGVVLGDHSGDRARH